MKPDGPVARRKDYCLKDLPHSEGAAFIKQYHYTKGCSNTAVFMHGLFRHNNLVGVAQWLPPTKVCAQSVHPDWTKVLSLSRLVVLDSEPLNTESILIGASVRAIRKTGDWVALVTFADEAQQHVGTIYKATNWRYAGRTGPYPRWENAEGRQVARKATRNRTNAEMLALGHVRKGSFYKHKFVQMLESPAANSDVEVKEELESSPAQRASYTAE